MKKIKIFNANRLTSLEFNQHIKNICNNINQLGEDFISDENLNNYIYNLSQKSIVYETAINKLTQSKETIRILDSEKERENSITTAVLLLNVSELSDNPKEQEAYSILHSIFEKFRDIQTSNFEDETNNIEKLINELISPKLAPTVDVLKMEPYIAEVQITNSIFKTFYSERSLEIPIADIYAIKTLRNEINAIYEDMTQYIFIMSRALNSEEYNKPLHLVNTIREYYADLLAKRSTSPAEIAEPHSNPISQN